MALRADPDGIAPERALVFEVAGSLGDFYSQVGGIRGLEFLLEDEVSIEPDDDFYVVKSKRGVRVRDEGPVSGRLYMAMPDLRALQEVLRLWDIYRRGQPLPRGFAPWRTLFDMLRDLRAWGPQDRVLPETLHFWREQIAERPDEPVRFEVELWYHERAERRARANGDVEVQVRELGGQVVSSATIEPIRYSGLLIDLPPDRVRMLVEHPDVTLARLDDIMYLRPQSVAVFPEPEEGEDELAAAPAAPAPAGDHIAALLDGVLVANHQLLVGRITLDDPDDFAARTRPRGARTEPAWRH